mmetsp:Transcript_38260/g.79781  ORF Transcript_38260/g.79781 Transcript_38260/m.79781 type:complete len:89 (+) Transcript_38260:48-314(+)|eukprot:s671_g2.t1
MHVDTPPEDSLKSFADAALLAVKIFCMHLQNLMCESCFLCVSVLTPTSQSSRTVLWPLLAARCTYDVRLLLAAGYVQLRMKTLRIVLA